MQRAFTYKNSGMREHLGLYSPERRRERYIIVYTWKIITGLAPNFESETSKIVTYYNERRGRLCRIPSFNNRAAARAQTIREDHCPC
jgi:hypothetical protein